MPGIRNKEAIPFFIVPQLHKAKTGVILLKFCLQLFTYVFVFSPDHRWKDSSSYGLWWGWLENTARHACLPDLAINVDLLFAVPAGPKFDISRI